MKEIKVQIPENDGEILTALDGTKVVAHISDNACKGCAFYRKNKKCRVEKIGLACENYNTKESFIFKEHVGKMYRECKTHDEIKGLLMKTVRQKDTGWRYLIIGVNPETNLVLYSGSCAHVSNLFKYFEFEDGTPCGVEVTE